MSVFTENQPATKNVVQFGDLSVIEMYDTRYTEIGFVFLIFHFFIIITSLRLLYY